MLSWPFAVYCLIWHTRTLKIITSLSNWLQHKTCTNTVVGSCDSYFCHVSSAAPKRKNSLCSPVMPLCDSPRLHHGICSDLQGQDSAEEMDNQPSPHLLIKKSFQFAFTGQVIRSRFDHNNNVAAHLHSSGNAIYLGLAVSLSNVPSGTKCMTGTGHAELCHSHHLSACLSNMLISMLLYMWHTCRIYCILEQMEKAAGGRT